MYKHAHNGNTAEDRLFSCAQKACSHALIYGKCSPPVFLCTQKLFPHASPPQMCPCHSSKHGGTGVSTHTPTALCSLPEKKAIVEKQFMHSQSRVSMETFWMACPPHHVPFSLAPLFSHPHPVSFRYATKDTFFRGSNLSIFCFSFASFLSSQFLLS